MRHTAEPYLLFFVCFISNIFYTVSVGFGPPYPVTASWFQDRFTGSEWNSTLYEFSKQGGDTVLLRAPPITIMTADELAVDPDLKWCGPACSNASKELSVLGLNVTVFGKYLYEEAFEETSFIQYPQYEKKIVSSRIYYRLVLPLVPGLESQSSDLTGTDVMVLFTSFAGIDPHELLLETAQDYNMSVYFGLPQPPFIVNNGNSEIAYMFSYVYFINRIVLDHKTRYSSSQANQTDKQLYSVLKGYSYSSEFKLTDVNIADLYILQLLQVIGSLTRSHDKQLAVSTYFQSNKYSQNSSLSEYINAFQKLIEAKSVDVISVKDGRGSGNGGFFWQTQLNTPIASADKFLHEILKNKYPFMSDNATFSNVFWTSIHEMFRNLADVRDKLSRSGNTVDLWLNVEAYEHLYDDPCLPVDRSSSGMDQMLNRIPKSRLDWALVHGSAFVQKVASFAWDSCFTCKTKNYTTSLANQIRADFDRPIISYCDFHNERNLSIVLIGYQLLAGFKVTWPHVDGHRVVSYVSGYYFEIDWGIEHDRVPSLMYTQLYDPYDIAHLAPKGYITVIPVGGNHACAFRWSDGFGEVQSTNADETKNYYYIERIPKYRIYGQNKARQSDNTS